MGSRIIKKYITPELLNTNNTAIKGYIDTKDALLASKSIENLTITQSVSSSDVVFTLTTVNGYSFERHLNVPTGKYITGATLDYANKKLIFTFSDTTTLACDISDLINTLEAKIATEKSERQAADTVLQTNITNEATTRQSADTALGGRIDSEAAARESGDLALGADITAEALARTAADTALDVRIQNVEGRGRYLSIWNCVTGLPADNPTTLPYSYKSGDYFVVGEVNTESGGVNYKPFGNQYTGAASTTVETLEVTTEDAYYFDGTNWHLQINTRKTTTFANIAGQPSDNINLNTALNSKQETLVSGTNIKTVNSTSLLGSGDIAIPVVSATAQDTNKLGSITINGTTYQNIPFKVRYNALSIGGSNVGNGFDYGSTIIGTNITCSEYNNRGEVAVGKSSRVFGNNSISIGMGTWNYIDTSITFDGWMNNYINRTMHMFDMSKIFFRNEDISSSKTTFASYTTGYSLDERLNGLTITDNSITELDYNKINARSISANTTFTFKAVPTSTGTNLSCNPEYKLKLGVSAQSTITLGSGLTFKLISNDDNIVIANGNELTLPIATKIELSIQDGLIVALNHDIIGA